MTIPICFVLSLFACLLSFRAIPATEAPLRFVTLEYPPYILNVNGEARGIVVDTVREAFRRSGRTIDVAFYPWSRALGMVESGQVDGLFTIKKTPERETVLRYPKETLLNQDYVFFVRQHSIVRFDGNYDSIAPAVIGVIRNTSYGARFDDAVKQGIFGKLEYANDYEGKFRLLLTGRADAVICSRLVGLKTLRRLKASDRVTISGPPSETTASYLVLTRQYGSDRRRL